MNVQLRRALLDYGPLALFFAAQKLFDIYVATEVLIVSIVLALGITYAIERRLTTPSIVMAVLVLVFGGLTVVLHDDTFVKVKLTVFYAFFGLVLLGGLYFNRIFLKYAFVFAFELGIGAQAVAHADLAARRLFLSRCAERDCTAH